MSQVFAAINHGLTGEYVSIVLPDQDAKDRLTADVKYLHEKLSTLKNVAGASTAMLMTVVSEKPTTAQPPRTTTNDRIRGMLTRQSSVSTPPTPPEPSRSTLQESPFPAHSPPLNGVNGLTSPPLPALPDGELMGNGVEPVLTIPQITVNGELEV